MDCAVTRYHGARAAFLACLDAELLHHGIGRDARRRKLDAHAAGRQVGALAGDIARAVEHDHGLVAALGKRGNVVDECGARHIVDVAGIRIVRMVVHELFVARRAVDHVVTVDHQQLGLIGMHRRDRIGDGLRKRIAAHAIGRGRNNRLGRAFAKALGLGLGAVLLGHALLLPHELAGVAT